MSQRVKSSFILQFMPKLFTTLGENYGGAALLQDLTAGLTVAVVAVPLCIAIAIASGATAQVGLTTVIVGGVLISFLGGSRTQVGGPTAAFIVVVLSINIEFGFSGLLTATFMAGGLLVLASLLHLGSLVRYVPESVVRGFTIGIALVIALTQMSNFFGLPAGPPDPGFVSGLQAVWSERSMINPSAIGVGLLTILIIVGFRRFVPRVPGIIVAAIAGALAVNLLGLPVDTIASRFGEFSYQFPLPHLPELSVARLVELLPSALVIAFLAGVESLLSATIADGMSGGRHRPNAEVMAQGIANLGSAWLGGLPVTGAIARTATNIRAGGRTPVAGISHALFVLIFLSAAAPLVGYLTLPTLAGTLLVTVWAMSEPHKLPRLMRGHRDETLVLVLTGVLTVFSGLAVAIGVGTALGLMIRMRQRRTPVPDWQRRQD